MQTPQPESTQSRRDHPRLMLLFTRGVSLRTWDRVGMFEREVELYRRLLPELSGIRFLTYGDGGERNFQERLDGIDIVPNDRRLTPTKFSILAPFLLRRKFRSADIIKTNQINGAWTGVVAKLLFRKKLIVRCGYLWSVFKRKRVGPSFEARVAAALEKACLKLANVCLVASPCDAEYIKRVHGISDSKIRVVPNYVDTELFRPMPKVEKEPRLVCFVGRLSPQKNVGALLEACRGLEGVRLLVIGDGELRDVLRDKAEALNLAVEFHRSIPNKELSLYLNRAQAFVLPSNYEGCPKTLLEAMACELPVVGTDVEGIRDIISHGENGILCDTSPESIRSAIASVLDDADSAERLAKKARQYVLERHSVERIVQMELEIIRTLCEG